MKKTDPTELMKKHDEAIRIENALSGLSEDGIGVANPGNIIFNLLKRNIQLALLCMRIITLQDTQKSQ